MRIIPAGLLATVTIAGQSQMALSQQPISKGEWTFKNEKLESVTFVVERYIQTLQQQVLDFFIVFGEQHMDHIVTEAVEHYHEERPHQSKENELLCK